MLATVRFYDCDNIDNNAWVAPAEFTTFDEFETYIERNFNDYGFDKRRNYPEFKYPYSIERLYHIAVAITDANIKDYELDDFSKWLNSNLNPFFPMDKMGKKFREEYNTNKTLSKFDVSLMISDVRKKIGAEKNFSCVMMDL